MLPSKRVAAGELVGDDSIATGESLLKKTRIDCLHSCVTVAATDNNNSKNSNSNNNQINFTHGSSETVNPSNMALDAEKPAEIDEDLHSRQLAVYGRETMRRLFASDILISGIQGLGAEIAKNLVLAGVKSVTLHDECTVQLWDLSSNFIFSENDVGKNRALASVQKLQELNNAVAVSTLTTTLTKEQLSNFQAPIIQKCEFCLMGKRCKT
ncbi:E1 ubiquitin-activating enzyme [Ranunculus cassubicifolius]